MNVMEVRRSGDWWVAGADARIAPVVKTHGPESSSADPGAGRRMLLGVRPENVSLSGGQTAGRVDVVEETGPSKIVLANLSGVQMRLLVPATEQVRPGDEIAPRVDPGAVVIWRRRPGGEP
jgi:ABC-type sugar transport system ATPase subunit